LIREAQALEIVVELADFVVTAETEDISLTARRYIEHVSMMDLLHCSLLMASFPFVSLFVN
jgi:hypothetical protein